jgi:Ca2+-binding EF-hand superfamily protein
MGSSQAKGGQKKVVVVNKKVSILRNPVNEKSSSTFKSLSKNDIERIQSECLITEAEIKNKYDIFMAFCDKSSKLNEKNFYELCFSLKNEIPEHLRRYSNLVFRSIDSNHDGFVNFHDFIIAFQSIIRGDLRRKLEYAFLLYDSDGSGRLDVDKIRNFIEVMLKILQAEKHFNPQLVAENCFVLLDKKRTGLVGKGLFILRAAL